MRMAAGPFWLVLLSLAPLRGAEMGARELLKQVAAEYESATDYYMRVETKSGGAAHEYILAASRPDQLMMRQKALKGERFELAIVADREAAWGYLPLKKLYTRAGAERGTERETLERVHERFASRFRLLDRIGVTVESNGHGNVRVDGGEVRCVRLVLRPEGERWSEELWIDPEGRRVLKLVAKHRLPFPETGVAGTTTIWKECRMNQPLDAGLFAFRAPAGAQRTNTLEYR